MRNTATFSSSLTVLLALIGVTSPSFAAAPVVTPPVAPAHALRSFADWKAACARLPSNRSLRQQLPPRALLPLPKFAELNAVVTAFFELCQTGALARATNWVGETPSNQTFFNTAAAYFMPSPTNATAPAIPFQPFAQKLSVPEGSEIFFRADLHGDVKSLLADLSWLNETGLLSGFTIVRPDFYMIFLGDYTDRGAYGVEVLYTLLRLKLANPERVFLARGNHEEVGLQARYGFLQEGRAKYGGEFDARRVERAYDFLPVVIYAGSGENFLQGNHGGMEPGFAPQALLESAGPLNWQFLGALNQRTYLNAHPEYLTGADAESRATVQEYWRDFQPLSPVSPVSIGFMWNDFSVLLSEPQFGVDPGRAFVHGAGSVQRLLAGVSTPTRRVQAVFRGHQQSSLPNPMMRRLLASHGVFRHWQAADHAGLLNAPVAQLTNILEQAEVRAIPAGSVWTFNVSPDSVYGEGNGYAFDAFGLLKLTREFAGWRLRIVNVPVTP